MPPVGYNVPRSRATSYRIFAFAASPNSLSTRKRGFAMEARRRTVVLAVALTLCSSCASTVAAFAAEPQSLRDKTLVVWAKPANLEQRGSGTLSVLERDVVDSIVLAEVRPGVWMPGSDHFDRTKTEQGGWPRDARCEMVCIAIAYEGKTIRLYSNAKLAAEYEIEAPHRFGPKVDGGISTLT